MNEASKTALNFLPHGPEFRFIDSVTMLDPGKEGTAEYRLRGDEAFLRGHFPGQPLLPGVLPTVAPLADLKLTAIRSAKIMGTARPGETVRLSAKVEGRLGNLIQASASAWVGEVPVLLTQLTLSGS